MNHCPPCAAVFTDLPSLSSFHSLGNSSCGEDWKTFFPGFENKREGKLSIKWWEIFILLPVKYWSSIVPQMPWLSGNPVWPLLLILGGTVCDPTPWVKPSLPPELNSECPHWVTADFGQALMSQSHSLLNFLSSSWTQTLKTVWNIVEAPFKKLLNFDVCVVWWCSDGPINRQEYKSLETYVVTIKIFRTGYHHWINGQAYYLF